MSDYSDEDDLDGFIVEDDQLTASTSSPRKRAGGARDKGKGKAAEKDTRRKRHPARQSGTDGYTWEGEFQRTWDVVREDESGSLEGAVNEFIERNKRRRLLRDTDTIQRGIIRHIYLVIDLSLAMLDRDLRPSRLELTLTYCQDFVNEFFDQNPISQMGIIGMRNGIAERLSPLSGNPVDHIKALQNKRKLEPAGEPSLQNGLEMARAGLSHLPPHGSREVVAIFGSLTTCDPGNIMITMDALVKDRMRVSVIGLCAEMNICKQIAKRTNGNYGVVVNEPHFKDLLFECVPPPAVAADAAAEAIAAGGVNASGAAAKRARMTATANNNQGADLILMGFPTMLATQSFPTFCSCHAKLKSAGFICPRCKSQICEVPSDCGICGLTVVSSPHLARSYRHLFPVKNFVVVAEHDLATDEDPVCYACSNYFPEHNTSRSNAMGQTPAANSANISLTGRYACPKCRHHFCIDCDTFIHDVLAVCPGCS